MNAFRDYRSSIGMIVALFVATLVRGQAPAPNAPPNMDAIAAGLKTDDPQKRIDAAKAIEKWFELFAAKQRASTGFSDLPVQSSQHHNAKGEAPAQPASQIVEQLIELLEPLLANSDTNVSTAAASAIASVPLKTQKVNAVLVRGLKLRNPKLDGQLLHAVERFKPDPQQVVPLLVERIGDCKEWPYKYGWALSKYGDSAKPAIPRLAAWLMHEEKMIRRTAANSLLHIGVDEVTARDLESGRIKVHPSLSGDMFLILLPYPALAAKYVRAHPELGKELDGAHSRVAWKLSEGGVEINELLTALANTKDLPSSLMAVVGSEQFLPELAARLNLAGARERAFLEACARACGKKPDRAFRISKAQPEVPKPKSAWPNSDERRWAKGGRGHADGSTEIVVTGRLLMEDGSPPKSPEFYATNDRFLLGQAQQGHEPIRYDSKTGRFVYVTDVFAAYSVGDGKREPGPYQTGSAQTLIQADGAEPLTVRFYDEMPDLEIVLAPKKSQKEVAPD